MCPSNILLFLFKGNDIFGPNQTEIEVDNDIVMVRMSLLLTDKHDNPLFCEWNSPRNWGFEGPTTADSKAKKWIRFNIEFLG